MKQSSRPVKIVATVGTSSDSEATLRALVNAGVNIFRYNFSHVNVEQFHKIVSTIRKIEKSVGRPISIMGDIAGPKIRLGTVVPGSHLAKGTRVTIRRENVMGTSEEFSLSHPAMLDHMEVGAEVYLGDGDAMMLVEKVQKDAVVVKVVSGGDIRSRMGFSVQGMKGVSFTISKKDREDIKLCLESGLDAIAVSFVQSAADIKSVRRLLPSKNAPLVIAKIETADAVTAANEILDIADGIMVARGDLALALPMEEVPFIQKQLIRLGLAKAKPVIVATQMLESMMLRPLPTRAEVADVTKAVLDGADCVMLSGETATGKHPVEVVRRMAKIIDTSAPRINPRWHDIVGSVSDAVTSSLVEVADDISAKLIIALTLSGCTARNVARHRYATPILAVSSSPQALRKLNFTWNVFPFHINNLQSFQDVQKQARIAATKNTVRPLKRGQRYIVSAGFPLGTAGSTNLMFVDEV